MRNSTKKKSSVKTKKRNTINKIGKINDIYVPHTIKHNSIKNVDTLVDTLDNINNLNNSENDNNQYNYIFEDEKDKHKNQQHKDNKNNKNNKTKKDYTSILNNNYIWLKEERKLAFKQGKGYGAGTIKEEVSACVSLLTVHPSIFIDIGAHVGDYTREVLRRYPNINAFLFEPSSVNKPILENEFSKLPNVSINACALSNNNGKQNLYYDKPGSVLASLTNRRLEHFNIDMNNNETVDIKRFDTFWKTTEYKDTTIIDYVKIDVEGWELSVLQGFGELIYNMRVIQFEFGGSNIDTRTFFQDFWYFFKEKNFALFRITPIGNLPIIKYAELDEFFSTTNYIAVNKKYNDVEIIDKYQENIANNQNKNNLNANANANANPKTYSIKQKNKSKKKAKYIKQIYYKK